MRGFTLIELLVTLVIIGILASVSYPLYTNHLTKTRRATAEAQLLQVAHDMERYYLQHHSYSGATLDAIGVPSVSNDDFYEFEIISATPTAFILHAIPHDTQALADEECGTLTFDSQGVKGNLGTKNTAECW